MKKVYLFTCIICLLFTPLASQSQMVATVGGNGISGATGDGGMATAAELNLPWGLATDAAGNIYIGDLLNNKVRKITPAGIISTFAGTGAAAYSGDGGPATAATLTEPCGVAVDAAGNVYIADARNYCIRKVNTSGVISTYAGTGTPGYSGDGGSAVAATISASNGIALDTAGNLYIGDTYNYCIRKVTPAGIISTIAGTGFSGESGDGGPATNATMSYVNNVAVDNQGNVYISDYDNSRLRIVYPSGIINTFAGTGYYGYSGDGGPATAADIAGIAGILIDAAGNVIISDINNNVIRAVSPAGIINTYAGTGYAGYSGDGGPATAAAFNRPGILAFDACGTNMYIADCSNDVIRGIIATYYTGASVITGPTSVCPEQRIALSDSTPGGTWGSSDTLVASIDSTGVVTGNSIGLATISYAVTTGCGTSIVTHAVIVNPYAGIISGTPSVCMGDTTTLTNIVTVGTWSSVNTAVATISGAGLVTGVTGGLDTIRYIVFDTCGSDTALFPIIVGHCTTGIQNTGNPAAISMSVFPNPVQGTVYVTINCATKEAAQITITNVFGEKVKQFSILTNEESENTLSVAPGIYFMSAVTRDEKITAKIVVR